MEIFKSWLRDEKSDGCTAIDIDAAIAKLEELERQKESGKQNMLNTVYQICGWYNIQIKGMALLAGCDPIDPPPAFKQMMPGFIDDPVSVFGALEFKESRYDFEDYSPKRVLMELLFRKKYGFLVELDLPVVKISKEGANTVYTFGRRRRAVVYCEQITDLPKLIKKTAEFWIEQDKQQLQPAKAV